MRKVVLQAVLAVAALALTLPVMAKDAKPSTDTKPKTVTMNFYDSAKVGATMITPGKYKMVFNSDKVTIENSDNNKVVATVPGHWEDQKQKQSETGFTMDNGQVKQIFVQGEARAFVVGS